MKRNRALTHVKRVARALDAGRDRALDAFIHATRPREVVRASQSYADGENLAVRRQPMTVQRYDTGSKLEFVAIMAGHAVPFDAWPDEVRTRSDLDQQAVDAAHERYGPYALSWAIWRIEPVNERAREAFPDL